MILLAYVIKFLQLWNQFVGLYLVTFYVNLCNLVEKWIVIAQRLWLETSRSCGVVENWRRQRKIELTMQSLTTTGFFFPFSLHSHHLSNFGALPLRAEEILPQWAFHISAEIKSLKVCVICLVKCPSLIHVKHRFMFVDFSCSPQLFNYCSSNFRSKWADSSLYQATNREDTNPQTGKRRCYWRRYL